MDQQAAMRWTQRNIAKFGDDPQRVMMGGESATASAVYMHLTSPSAQGLFMRGTMQSGNCFATPLATLETSGSNYAAAAGWTDATTAAQCLQSKSPLDILRAASSKAVITRPVIGGNLLPRAPFEVIRAGTWNKVPMIIGANHERFNACVALDHRPARLRHAIALMPGSSFIDGTGACPEQVPGPSAADGSLAHAYPARCTKTGRPDP